MSLISSQDIATLLQKLTEKFLESEAADDPEGWQQYLSPEIINTLPNATALINSALDDLTETVVEECLIEGEVPHQASAIDWMELRNAANEVNDWQQLLDLEKNFLADVFGKIVEKASVGGPESSPNTGGQVGSPT